MPVVLAGALLVVAVCSVARLVRHGTHAHRESAPPLDVEVWHGLMGLAMAVMLLVGLTQLESRVAMMAFAVGAAWCVVRLAGHASRAAYLRLGACCTAMSVMLVPAAITAAGAATSSAHAPEMGGMDMPGMDMSGMATAGMDSHAAAGGSMAGMPGMQPGSLPPLLVVVLLVAMAAVVVAGAGRIALPRVGSRRTGTTHRMQAFGEMAMAGAMAYMLAGLV